MHFEECDKIAYGHICRDSYYYVALADTCNLTRVFNIGIVIYDVPVKYSDLTTMSSVG